MKTCKQCGEEKELTEYSPRATQCKPCRNQASAEYRKGRRDYFQEKARKWRAKNPERKQANNQDWYRRNKQAHSESKDEYRKANPEKIVAHWAVGNAVRRGKLVTPNECSECGSDSRLHAHHDDYSKPLEVRWLCVACHSQHHNQQEIA
jgi:ribosomal protein S27AE